MPVATLRPLPPLRKVPIVPRPASSAPTAAMQPKPRRSFVLDVPFEARTHAQSFGAAYDAKIKAFLFKGTELPPQISHYASERYSWERFQEDQLNGVEPVASPPEDTVVLRPHQIECVEAINRARAAGRTGFLVGDDVGLGKTMETWAAILAQPDLEDVLIVCPLAVVAHWRRTIRRMGDGGKRIVVINYDRIKKVFEVPATIPTKSRKRKVKARKVRTQKGIVRHGEAQEFDVVVLDESHKCKNMETARSGLVRKLAANAEFLLWLSATAGQNPLELNYLAPLLSESTGSRVKDLEEFEKWCQAQGIGLSRGKFGKWSWDGKEEDLHTMRRLLYGGQVPSGIRRSPVDIAGWPEINRILLPVSLDAADKALYADLWSEFRDELGMSRGHDSSNGRVAQLRFRQKSSLLRTAATVDLSIDLLEQGLQVAISVAFRETMEVLVEALSKTGYDVTTIDGSLGAGAKEQRRLDFQYGRAQVCVYTVEEAISLHQREFPDASDAPRANLIHDLRWSAISMKQIEGRTHRDGKFSQAYWMLGEDTVEEGIAEVVAGRMKSMSVMQGDDGTVRAIEEMLRKAA